MNNNEWNNEYKIFTNTKDRFQIIEGNKPLVYGYFIRQELGLANVPIYHQVGILPFFILDRGFEAYICTPEPPMKHNLLVKIHLGFLRDNINDSNIDIRAITTVTIRLKIFNQYTLNKFSEFMKLNENYFSICNL